MSATPTITDELRAESVQARAVLRPHIEALAALAANALRTQPLSVKQLLATMLIEDFVSLDCAAAQNWLQAISWEHEPAATERDGWIEQRLTACQQMADAEIARRARVIEAQP